METVVLLHSSASSAAQWRALAAQLSGATASSRPTSTATAALAHWPGSGAFSLAHEAEIVHALLDHAGAPAHLVGHSYGGAVALHVARLHGERVRSLVADRAGRVSSADRSLGDHMRSPKASRAPLPAATTSAAAASFFDYWSGPGSWDAIPPRDARRDGCRGSPKVALDFHAVLTSRPALRTFAGARPFRRCSCRARARRGRRAASASCSPASCPTRGSITIERRRPHGAAHPSPIRSTP